MKTKLFTLVFALFLVSGLNAQVLMVEDFNYTAGDSLGAHGWTSFSGGNTNVLSVVSPGLTFTGYSGSGVGNAALIQTTGQDAYKPLTNPDSTGSFYISMMVRVDSMKTGDYFFALLPSTSTTLYAARLYVKDSTGLRFGIIKSTTANGPLVYTPTTYTLGVTYLLVVKYKFLTGTTTDDEISLYVFPTTLPGTEPTTPTVGPITGLTSDMSNLGRIALRQGTSSSMPYLKVDGFKISKSWSSVVSSVTPISTIADNFSLSQNYPNPFNPSTTINFSIPKSGFVTLKVYDVNGREVKSLVNGNMNAGKYEVNSNFSTLNSGVYFYTLNVSGDANYSETKKLMLVK